MAARAATLCGHARSHTPSPAAPLVLVLVEELAMLTTYCRTGAMVRDVAAADGVCGWPLIRRVQDRDT
jgi:hypothetical protein